MKDNTINSDDTDARDADVPPETISASACNAALSGLGCVTYLPGQPTAATATVRVYEGAPRVTVKVAPRPYTPPAHRRPRGRCSGVTRGTKLRQLQRLNSINQYRLENVYFLTLTLPVVTTAPTPGDLTVAWQRIEHVRRKHEKRLQRYLCGKQWFGVWAKEAHVSGYPHLHLLICFRSGDAPSLATLRTWNDAAWAGAAANPAIARTACNCRRVRDFDRAKRYLSKWDPEKLPHLTGRVWGVINKQHVPVDIEHHVVALPAANKVARACRKWQQRQAERWYVWRSINGNPAGWARIRPWTTHGGRRIEVDEQLAAYRDQGMRLKRYRPKLSRTFLVGGVPRTYFAQNFYPRRGTGGRLLTWAVASHLAAIDDDTSTAIDVPDGPPVDEFPRVAQR